jgi:hypothetical protein
MDIAPFDVHIEFIVMDGPAGENLADKGLSTGGL